jgi:hypothetical protein
MVMAVGSLLLAPLVFRCVFLCVDVQNAIMKHGAFVCSLVHALTPSYK